MPRRRDNRSFDRHIRCALFFSLLAAFREAPGIDRVDNALGCQLGLDVVFRSRQLVKNYGLFCRGAPL